MFIKINDYFYNLNNILRFSIKNHALTIEFVNNESIIIHNINEDVVNLLNKLKYES